jgi:hypothetical protein
MRYGFPKNPIAKNHLKQIPKTKVTPNSTSLVQKVQNDKHAHCLINGFLTKQM